MNSNRGNSRRRGRGSNRQQGNQQLNRIDSRARGNAPQLLEKYKKLAHDAHLNGDRVQEEHCLQFADHYFRVIADQKQRQEEARQRRDERQQDSGESDRDSDARSATGDSGEDDVRHGDGGSSGETEADDRSSYEPAENPFVRDNRSARGSKQRKPRRESRDGEDGDDGSGRYSEEQQSVDPSVLPPSIGADQGEEAPSGKKKDAASEDEAEPKPRRRTRRQRPDSDSGGPLEAVN